MDVIVKIKTPEEPQTEQIDFALQNKFLQTYVFFLPSQTYAVFKYYEVKILLYNYITLQVV